MYKLVLQNETGVTVIAFDSEAAAKGLSIHLAGTLSAKYLVVLDSFLGTICYERIKMPDGNWLTTAGS